MKDFEYITLEDGIDYLVIDEINNFLFLTNENDQKDFCIRKIQTIDSKEMVVPLANDNEFNEALKLYQEKNK